MRIINNYMRYCIVLSLFLIFHWRGNCEEVIFPKRKDVIPQNDIRETKLAPETVPFCISTTKNILVRLTKIGDGKKFHMVKFSIPVNAEISQTESIKIINPYIETQVFKYELNKNDSFITKNYLFKSGSVIYLRINMRKLGACRFEETLPEIVKYNEKELDNTSRRACTALISMFYTLEIIKYDKKSKKAIIDYVIDGGQCLIPLETTILLGMPNKEKDVF